MEHENIEVHDGVEVPESPLLRLEPKNRYGSVPGLDDEELADPDELERQVIREELGPILLLPVPPRRSWMQAVVDESLGVYRGAFDSADFLDRQPQFDWARSEAGRLREELKSVFIMIDTVKERLPAKARSVILRYSTARAGSIRSEDLFSRLGPHPRDARET